MERNQLWADAAAEYVERVANIRKPVANDWAVQQFLPYIANRDISDGLSEELWNFLYDDVWAMLMERFPPSLEIEERTMHEFVQLTTEFIDRLEAVEHTV